MSERSSGDGHGPKLAALMALDEGRLSTEGEARLRRHLLGCAACREAQGVMAGYALLREEVRALPAPKLAYPGIDALEPPVQAPPVTPLRRYLPAALALAAAAALAYLPAAEPHGPGEPRAATTQPTVAPVAVPVVATPTLALGGPRPDPAAGWREGARLSTGAGELLHVRLGVGTGFVLAADSELVLQRLRRGDVKLRLLRGAVTSLVAPLAAGGRYEIWHGDDRVAVRGTHFRVAAVAGGTAVQVDEGVVEVRRGGALAARLEAPARWPSDAAGDAGLALAEALPRVLGLAFEGAAATLALPTLPNLQAWEVEGARLPPGALRLRRPPGVVELGALLTDGRRETVLLQVPEGGLWLDAAGLLARVPALTEAPALPPRRHVSPDSLGRVVKGARPAFQRCYERAMKVDPALRPSMTLRIRLDAAGRVAGARVDGEAPVEFQRCVRAAARTRRFPAPGGDGLEFAAPLKFRQRR